MQPADEAAMCIWREANCTGDTRAWHVARMTEGRGVHKVLVGKTEGKKPLGRPRRRWEDNINLLATDFFSNFGTPCI